MLNLIEQTEQAARRAELRRALGFDKIEIDLIEVEKQTLSYIDTLEEIPAVAELGGEAMGELAQFGLRTFGQLDEAISDTLLNGAQGFRAFASQAIQELNRIAVRSALISILPEGSILGAALGLQFGGPFGPTNRIIVGERGPEMLTLGQSGRVDPLPAAAAPPQVNLIQVKDEDEALASVASSNGVSTLINIVAGNSEDFNNALGREGS